MNIGFDAPDFFGYNGAASYSRSIIFTMAKYLPGHEVHVFVPGRQPKGFSSGMENIRIITPGIQTNKEPGPLWYAFQAGRKLKKHQIKIYHGLHNELPRISSSYKDQLRLVLSVHHLTFLHHPDLFKQPEIEAYRESIRQNCSMADHIMVSEETTRTDLINHFQIPANKISMLTRPCDPFIQRTASEKEKKQIRDKYNLPDQYMLFAGKAENQKNIFLLAQAIEQTHKDIPLVILTSPTPYLRKLVKYLSTHLLDEVYFLTHPNFHDLPAIYQSARLFVYPSYYSGYGTPIVEAAYSNIPVITSEPDYSEKFSFERMFFIEPDNPTRLADKLNEVWDKKPDKKYPENTNQEKEQHKTNREIAEDLWQIYQKTIS